jgi:MFS family permease
MRTSSEWAVLVEMPATPNRSIAAPTAAQERLVTRPFVVVTLTALAFFIYIGMLLPMVPLFIEGPLGGGEFDIGVTVAAFSVAAIVARPLIGRAADRFGRRVVITFGALVAAISGALAGQVDALWVLVILRMFTGVGEASVFVGAATLIADLSPRARRAEGASYFSVAVFGGLGIGPVLGESLLDDTHYERAFLVAAAFALAAAAMSLFAPARVETPDDLIDADDEVDAEGIWRWIHRGAVMPGLVLACAVAAFAAYGAFLPDYARTVGLSSSGGLFAVYAFLSLLVRVFGARLPEQWGPRRAVTIALSNVMAGMALLALVPEIPALWLASAFMGLGIAFNYPSLMALAVNRASDRHRAKVVSSLTMFFEVGTAAGGLLIGALAQVVGKQWGFLGGAASCALGLWILRTKVVPADAPDAGPIMPADEVCSPVVGN